MESECSWSKSDNGTELKGMQRMMLLIIILTDYKPHCIWKVALITPSVCDCGWKFITSLFSQGSSILPAKHIFWSMQFNRLSVAINFGDNKQVLFLCKAMLQPIRSLHQERHLIDGVWACVAYCTWNFQRLIAPLCQIHLRAKNVFAFRREKKITF